MRQHSRKSDSTHDSVNSSSLKHDLQQLRLLLEKISQTHGLAKEEVLDMVEYEIPVSIYTKKLSPLETSVKYLKENLNLGFPRIAELLGRSRKTVWQAYANAAKKVSRPFKVKDTRYKVPISVLNSETKLSVLEATVKFVKEEYGLTYRDIGQLIQRDERTIWTVYQRALKKGDTKR
ncbi:hypothetical protein ACFL0V_06990 [Nanoarchaeota archaeon]